MALGTLGPVTSDSPELRRRVWLCDVNGVLVDSTDVVRRAFIATAARYGCAVNEDRLRATHGRCLADAYRWLDPGCAPEARCRYHVDFVSEHIHEIRAYPDVHRVLEAARAEGVRVGAATSYGRIAEASLVKTGLYPLIDYLVTQEEVARPKPSPDVLLRLVRLFGRDGDLPRDAVYVGDTPVDVQAGTAAGLTTIGVTYGFSNIADISEAAPDYLIHSFGQMRDVAGTFSPRGSMG